MPIRPVDSPPGPFDESGALERVGDQGVPCLGWRVEQVVDRDPTGEAARVAHRQRPRSFDGDADLSGERIVAVNESVGEQFAHGDLGVQRNPESEQAVVEFLLGIVRLDGLDEFDHYPQERCVQRTVGADGVVFVEHLEGNRMCRNEGLQHTRCAEQQCRAERDGTVDGPQAERRQQIDVREVGESHIAPGRGETSKTIQFMGIQILDRQPGQWPRRDVLATEESCPRLNLVRQHRQALRRAVHADGAPQVLPRGGRHDGCRLRHVHNHHVDVAARHHIDGDTDRRRRLVGDQSLEPAGVGHVAVTRPGADDPTGVVNADQEPASFPVGETHDSLGQFVVVDLGLELGGVCFAAGEEAFQSRFH